jgi:hypothetical protein
VGLTFTRQNTGDKVVNPPHLKKIIANQNCEHRPPAKSALPEKAYSLALSKKYYALFL